MEYMEHLSKEAYELSERSLFMSWFPTDLQAIFEVSAQSKLIDRDLDGLLGLITFAGIEFGEFQSVLKTIKKGYGKDKTKVMTGSAMNLAFILFGTVMNEVSELCGRRFFLLVLTKNFHSDMSFPGTITEMLPQ